MITQLALCVLVLILIYHFFVYKQVHYHFKKWGIKFKPGIPIFGNTFFSSFALKHVIEDIDAVYKAFPDEKYVGFMEGMKPVILVRDPELMKSITIKDFDHFVNRKALYPKEIEPLLGSSLLNMRDDEWRKMRSRLSGAFSGSKMRSMMPFMMEITNNIVEYLKGSHSQEIDVFDLMRRYATDVIASTGFGLRVNSLKNRKNKFYTIGQAAVSFTFWRRVYYFLTTQFPTIAKIMQFLGIQLLPSEGTQFFRKIVSDTIAYRKKNNIVRPDFIHLLMEASQDLTLDEITGQIYFAFLASYESTASTLTMCIHELALNHECQERLYQEIRSKQEKDGELTFEGIAELKYMDCVLNETMRKWSVALMMDRVCTKTYVLPPSTKDGQSYVVSPGDIVYNVVNSVQMDKVHHSEPELFNPDRFSDKNKNNIKSFTHMPFGMGPRNCLGMRYTMLKMKILLYHLVFNYQIKASKRTSDPICLEPHEFSIKAKEDLYVRFVPRM